MLSVPLIAFTYFIFVSGIVCMLFSAFMCNWYLFVFPCIRGLSGPLPATRSGLMIIHLKRTGLHSYGKNHVSFFCALMTIELIWTPGLVLKSRGVLLVTYHKYCYPLPTHGMSCKMGEQHLPVPYPNPPVPLEWAHNPLPKEGSHTQWWSKLTLYFSKSLASLNCWKIKEREAFKALVMKM